MRQSSVLAISLAIENAHGPGLRNQPITQSIRSPQSAIRNVAAPLFDGKSLEPGAATRAPRCPTGWRIADGTLTKDGHVGDIDHQGPVRRLRARARVADRRRGQQRHLLSRHRGIRLQGDLLTTASTRRPEYQLLDDIKGADNKTRLTCAAAAYGSTRRRAGHLKPVGDWNTPASSPGRARRALAQRRQDGRVRAVEPRLGSEGGGDQVQGLAEVRPRQGGTHRAPGRSRGRARVPQHPHPRGR